MSSLRSALEELQGEDLRRTADAALEADFSELQRAAAVVDAERLRRLAEIHRRQSHRRDGYLSTASWLVDRHRVGWQAAGKDIRTARSLQRMPHTRAGLSSGELSQSAVQMLISARQAHPAQFHEAEPNLVEAAKRLPAQQLHHTVAEWTRSLDWGQGLKDAELQWARRRLTVRTGLFGSIRLEGDLDPETGETVMTALRGWQDADRRARDPADDRSPAQRRADALGEICRRWLDAGTAPTTGGERPHVSVVVDLRALQGAERGRSELEHAGPVHPDLLRRWACDASISRVVTRGASEPLDIGRRTPTVPGPMRRALVVRDRHCRFPGCDRPPPWCDAHHIVHWADGGSTAISNLILLCRRHHRAVHAGRPYRLDTVDGAPRFNRVGDPRPAEGEPPEAAWNGIGSRTGSEERQLGRRIGEPGLSRSSPPSGAR